GVVGSIIDQCRKYDPALAPSVLPVGFNEEVSPAVLKQAAERVARALRRSSYFLAFDGLETYIWPATTHHGVTHMAVQRGKSRPSELCAFLRELKELGESRGLGGSRIGISADAPKSRHADNDLNDLLCLD